MKEEINKLCDLVFNNLGLDISGYDEIFLTKTIQARMDACNCNSIMLYIEHLRSFREELKEFIKSLNISYSEFFRNPLSFAVLEQLVLPSLVLKKQHAKEREIRIWSAACGEGQEPFSVVIQIDEFLKCSKSDIKFRVFATDANKETLHSAQKGNYLKRQLGNVSLNRIQSSFTHKGDTYTVLPRLRAMVDFSVFDLLSTHGSCPPASVYGSFDVIFCCNLLFYYKPIYRKRIIEKISGSLAPGGYVITGETEIEIFKEINYREVYPNSAILQQL
jgi:chemotaxis protein methyltransferase CheR